MALFDFNDPGDMELLIFLHLQALPLLLASTGPKTPVKKRLNRKHQLNRKDLLSRKHLLNLTRSPRPPICPAPLERMTRLTAEMETTR